jgi:hypothetical protein
MIPLFKAGSIGLPYETVPQMKFWNGFYKLGGKTGLTTGFSGIYPK